MKYKHTQDDLLKAVANSLSTAEVCRQLGIRPIGGNYKTLKAKFKEFEIDISHFTGAAWNVGTRYRQVKQAQDLNEIMIKDSAYKSSYKLHKRLIAEGFKEHICESCKNTHWLGEPIKLELHHVNGTNTDHRLENLQLLCPNCHAVTDHYRGRNTGVSALNESRAVEYRKFKEALANNADGNLEPSLSNEEGAETIHGTPKVRFPREYATKECLNCNTKFIAKEKTSKFCCVACYREYNRFSIPKVPEILEAFKEHKSFLQVGKHFDVSDNAVRKWCISYGILDMVKK